MATTLKTNPNARPKDNRHSIRINDPELYDSIERTAKERGWAISDLYREAIKEYLGRDQLKDDLAEFEKRVAASHRAVTKEQRRMRNDLEVMLALFDLFARSYFLHTPSVPPEAAEMAAQDGWRRYEKMRKQIAEMVRAQSGTLAIAKELNAELDSDGPTN